MKRTPLERKTPMARGPGIKPKEPAERKRRTRKCALKSCRAVFEPRSMTHKACSPVCAQALVEQVKARADRKARQEGLAKLKTKRDWVKEAQVAFNAFIRERDKDKPCICCGIPFSDPRFGGAVDAGHYRSVGSAPHQRFNELNCHAQSKQHNRYGAGRAVDYRIGLIAKIGLAAVEALEADNTPKHYSIDDLKVIKAHYQAKLRELKGKS